MHDLSVINSVEIILEVFFPPKTTAVVNLKRKVRNNKVVYDK